MGSWKIMLMRLPRRRQYSASDNPASSPPSSLMLPVTDALSGSSPISDNAVTDLPQPDSPTSPSVSPRFRAKLTPRTACAGPRLVLRRTPRLATSINGMVERSPILIAPAPVGDRADRAIRRRED